MTDTIIDAIAADPALARAIAKIRKDTATLKRIPDVIFANRVGSLLVDAGLLGPWELGDVDFGYIRFLYDNNKSPD